MNIITNNTQTIYILAVVQNITNSGKDINSQGIIQTADPTNPLLLTTMLVMQPSTIHIWFPKAQGIRNVNNHADKGLFGDYAQSRQMHLKWVRKMQITQIYCSS